MEEVKTRINRKRKGNISVILFPQLKENAHLESSDFQVRKEKSI